MRDAVIRLRRGGREEEMALLMPTVRSPDSLRHYSSAPASPIAFQVGDGRGGCGGSVTQKVKGGRGRHRTSPVSWSNRRAAWSRSLSPIREHGCSGDPPEGRASRKWRLLQHLLLPSFSFSSASEKRARVNTKAGAAASASARGGLRRSGCGSPLSAHEIHYTANRAASEQRRKQTPLPYQQTGLIGFFQKKRSYASLLARFAINIHHQGPSLAGDDHNIASKAEGQEEGANVDGHNGCHEDQEEEELMRENGKREENLIYF
ncbi:hypothetical protein AXF42_Ash001952 [Apostasia shenzhenica]|uniref:Uncharacterized protein n=1 Tax=Apostasia shenzhenica TaxID=1088818 RepID=A0A2I0ABQ0_9ASPA|nr:hypothetical protein AXF42_Ash001952 [Apostasia shenzhenica]